MILRRAVGVDHHHLARRPSATGRMPPQEFVGLLDLVIHVDHQHAVEAVRRAAWDRPGSPSFTLTLSSRSRATRWASASRTCGHDILGQHAAVLADAAAPGGSCNSPRPRRYRRRSCPWRSPPCPSPRPASLSRSRASSVDQRDETIVRDRAVGGGERPGLSRLVAHRPRGAAVARGERAATRRSSEPRTHQSTSSTSTASPVTRCDSAAAMNASRSPSSTSDGAVEVTPVRRSFTS